MRLNDLDLTIVVRNDQQYGAELKYLAAACLPPDIARQTLPDVPALPVPSAATAWSSTTCRSCATSIWTGPVCS